MPQVGIDLHDEELVASLSFMSHGKCAFCEARDDLVAHRFRPAGNALPFGERKNPHLFYVWLADAWQNLLPICLGCRPENATFPVDGERCHLPSQQQISAYLKRGDGRWSTVPKERALLIDPTRETSYDHHFKPKLDGTLIAISPRATMTAEHFGINREDRRQARASALLKCCNRLRQLIVKGRISSQQHGQAWIELFDFDSLDFGGAWSLLLKRIADRIDIGKANPRRTKLKAFFISLAATTDGSVQFENAMSAIVREDPGLRSVELGSQRLLRVRATLRSVELENFKSVERLRIDLLESASDRDGEPSPSLIVLGENATGKSALLEAIALTLATPEARRQLGVAWKDIPLDPSYVGAAGQMQPLIARVRAEFDSGQISELTIKDGEAKVRSEFGSEKITLFAYGAFRRFDDYAATASTIQHIHNLFDAGSLPNPEPWLRSLSAEVFDMVVRTLRDLLSIEGDFEVLQRSGRGRQLRMVTALQGSDGITRLISAPLKAVSSGYRSMLGMLCDILRGLLDAGPAEAFAGFTSARGIILIDEIEAHLHPRWKVQVMSSLRRALPGMTFIVTTHDPLCLRGMEAGEVIVLQRVVSTELAIETDLPTTIEKIDNLPDPSELRLEQLLTSDFFQMFSSNDAAVDRRMARIGDILRKREEREPLNDDDVRVFNEFERDIADALPVGSSEVHRQVQSAVATFLEHRRDASSVKLAKLGDDARAEILKALEAV